MSKINVEQILDEVREKCIQENEAMLYWNYGAVNVLPIVQDYRSKNQAYPWLVVTNSRLILFQPSFLGKSGVKYIPLKSIQSTTLIEKWLDMTHLEILTQNEIIEVNALNPHDIWHSDKKALLTKLSEAINNVLRDSEHFTVPLTASASGVEIADQIQTRLEALDILFKVKKAITEEEYADKRQEILNHL